MNEQVLREPGLNPCWNRPAVTAHAGYLDEVELYE
jgi:hypothetical protein